MKVTIILSVCILLSSFPCTESTAQTECVASKDATKMVKLKAGMTVEEVVALVGQPDNIDTNVGKNGEQVLVYFYFPTPKDKETRNIFPNLATADGRKIFVYETTAKPNDGKSEPIKKSATDEKYPKMQTNNSPYFVTFINGKVSKIDIPKDMILKINPKS